MVLRDIASIEEARRALAQVHDDPAAIELTMTQLLDRTTDVEARQAANWARGRARHERGRFAGALEDLHTAARLAGARGDSVDAARIDAHRALTEYAVGDTAAAIGSLQRAEGVLTGLDAGLLHHQWAIIEVHRGELLRARDRFDRALGLLSAAGDDTAVARCLASRGVANTYLGRFDEAVADHAAAAAAATATGQRLIAAGAVHNLGYSRGRLGDVPAALRLLAEARALYEDLVSPARVVACLEQDRAEILLQAGLAPEAAAAAEAAVARHEVDGAHTAAADALLLLAEAELAAGRRTAAAATAERAAARFDADGRTAWAARARYVGLRADLADVDLEVAPSSPALFDRSCALARVLEEAGWLGEAVDVWTFAGRVALALGRPDDAREPLRIAARARGAGPIMTRVRAWHAVALSRLADGQTAGATRAAAAGLRLVALHRSALVAPELRAGAAGHGLELARLGLRLALRERRPARVFAWAEQARARALASPAVEPHPDTHLRSLLGSLRAAHAKLRSAPGSVEDRRAVAALEASIRDYDHCRAGGSDSAAGAEERVELPALRAAIGDGVYVSFVELDGRLHSLVVSARRTSLRDHGVAAPVGATVERLRFTLSRLAYPSTERGAAAALAGLDADCRTLDGLLGLADLPDGRLVLTPSGALNGAPWAALPSLSGRPVTVTPSATVWATAHKPAPGGAGTCFVAGPNLPAAATEVATAAAFYPGATILRDEEATIARVVDAFTSHRVLHVAAHGRFRSDSPLFSGLDLADGALALFDLDGVTSAADVVVLPACHLASTRLLPGEEPLGAVATLVHLGVGTVIAPAGAVPDHATAALMVELHRHLAAGVPPPDALALAASASISTADPAAVACGALFVATGRQ